MNYELHRAAHTEPTEPKLLRRCLGGHAMPAIIAFA
jgi:hypothetical protein